MNSLTWTASSTNCSGAPSQHAAPGQTARACWPGRRPGGRRHERNGHGDRSAPAEVSGGMVSDMTLDESVTNPGETGRGNPAQSVVDAAAECLSLASTWLAWDGRPLARFDEGLPNVWTPHKALRRVTDHLIDHLHEVEALLAGAEPVPDEWHGRVVTLDADWSRFTELDLDEARSRVSRLARSYLLRYEVAGPQAWDEPRSPAWTLREIAEHVAGVRYYAEQVGRLA